MVPRPAIAAIILAVAACVPRLATSQQFYSNDLLPPRRLDIGLINTDEYADAMVTVQASPETPLVGMGKQDHETISRILDTTKEMVGTGRSLIQNKLTLKQGQDMLAQANNLFHEAKNIIQRQQQEQANRATSGGGQDDERECGGLPRCQWNSVSRQQRADRNPGSFHSGAQLLDSVYFRG